MVKKIYQRPEMNVVRVHHALMLCTSLNSVAGNADMNYGGGSSSEAARVKQNDYSVWDDAWNE